MNSHPERSNFVSLPHVLEVIYAMKNQKFEFILRLKQASPCTESSEEVLLPYYKLDLS